MTEQAKTPSGANAPYKIQKRGDKFVVLNNIGEVKATFKTEEEARKYQSALYASVPGAAKRAAKTPFTGKAKNRIKSADVVVTQNPPRPPVMDLRDRLAAPYKKAAGLPNHNFLPGVDNLCLSCGLPMAAPIHMVDADAMPGPIMPGPPPVKAEYTGSGSMVALYPGAVEKLGVDVQGGPDFPVEDQADWHITLAYLPETPEGDSLQLLTELVNELANVFPPLEGVWGGTARFNPSEGSDGKPVLVALPDLPGLPEFRQFVVRVLDAAGFPVSKDHGYQPHMTIAYDDNGRVRADGPIKFTSLTLATPDQRFNFDFKGETEGKEDVIAKAAFAGARGSLEHAAAKVVCTDCGQTYFADSKAEIDKHKATCPEKAKLSEADQKSVDAENERIKESAKTPEAKAVHDFKPAQWTHPNGHPRCKVCGQEESISPQCNREPTKAEMDAFDAELEAEFGKPEAAKDYSGKARSKMAKSGAAMSDGSFPIRNATDLKNAIQACGRASNPDAAKAHIKARARALGLTDMLPDSWKSEKAYVEVTERISPPDVVAPPKGLEHVRAFITEINGRTLLTAPASAFVPNWEKALTPNEHFLWVQGNFVGGEKANRNGAFWSTRDLEMGQPTVQHGPLNWLHEAKHVIGTIADSKLVLPAESAAEGGVKEPHIVAAAAIWKWIYPDEAYVVEQASDQSKLWYSMECVSREVSCEGENGCGESYPYMDVIRAKASVCQHIRQKASTRRFVDPTFLGAAVIVPPVRPGWADADARVMREAAALAELAYDDAGRPDMAATEWEQLMAQVVAYAES